MKICLNTMLLDVHKCFYGLLYKKITSMIAYFAAVARCNLARKEQKILRR